MARFTFGGSPWNVVQTVTGDVVPDWPVAVYDPDDLVNPLTDILEAGSDLAISELRTNPASHESPGLIRSFRGPDGLREIVYMFSGPDGRSHRWTEPAHEIAESLEDADAALILANQASSDSSAAFIMANQAQQAADISRQRAADAELVAQQAREAASAYISSISPAASVADLSSTTYIPHRCGSSIAPENSLEGLDAMVALDFPAVHVSVRRTLDGSLYCFGDWVLGQMTSLSGEPTNQITQGVVRGSITAGDWFCNTWPNTLKVPTLAQVIARAAKRTVLIIQLMDSGSVPAVVNLIKRMNAETYTIILSTERNDLRDLAAPQGVNCGFIDADPGSTNHALVVADGIEYYALSIFQSTTYINEATNAGLKVFSIGASRHSERDILPSSTFGVIVNDPVYLDPERDHRLSSDPYGGGSFYHGHLCLHNSFNPSNPGTGVQRGQFLNPTSGSGARQLMIPGNTNEPSYPGTVFQSVQMGWMNPIVDPTEYTITGTFQMHSWVSATRWLGVAFSMPSDRNWDNYTLTTNDRGYLGLVRQNGTIELYIMNGESQTLLGTTTTSAFTANSAKTFTVSVTSSGVSFTVSGQTVSTTSTSYRGSYSCLGIDRVNGRFYNLEVS